MSAAGAVYAHNITEVDAHGVYFITGVITDAQIKLLASGSTPVTLIPTQPRGNFIYLVYGELEFVVEAASGGSGTGYTGGGNLLLSYGATTDTTIATVVVDTFLTGTGNDQDAAIALVRNPTPSKVRKGVVNSASINKLIIHQASANFTGGGAGNLIRYKLWYRLIPMTFIA